MYSCLFRIGYYPYAWKEAIGVILLKLNKKDYLLPKSYRIISLINCLAKVLKKIVAIRLSYLANTIDLLNLS